MKNSAIPPLIWIVTSSFSLLHETGFGRFVLNLNSLCVVMVLKVVRTECNALVSFHVIKGYYTIKRHLKEKYTKLPFLSQYATI